MIDEVSAEGTVDPERVYLLDYSMGGYGCWALAAEHRDRFTAIMPVAGGGNPETASSLKDVPCWAIHGEADQVVAVSETKEMIGAVKNAGGRPKVSILPNLGHDVWGHFISNRETYLSWLLDQQRPHHDSPKKSPAD